jgi:exodeoxyribonuclease VII large subunit
MIFNAECFREIFALHQTLNMDYSQVEKNCLSVSELIESLNFLLEAHVPAVRFSGEISEVNVRAAVVYLKIKDENSVVSATLWRSQLGSLGFALEQGQKVVCQGTPNIFARFGTLSMRLSKIELAGEGELKKRFLLLKARLEKEGLFAQERKRSLPFFPKVVAVVTSANGAVIHDIMFKVRERMPQTQVWVVDVKVQGPEAAPEIASAIAYLNALADVDVMIVGRGGGSLQELWAFNEEEVVRAIFSSRIPVISAVGHESDVTLADLVADRRAPTPTGAAEMAVPSRADLLKRLSSVSATLSNIERWLLPKFQSYDYFCDRFNMALKDYFYRHQQRLQNYSLHLKSFEPANLLAQNRESVSRLQQQLQRACTHGLQSQQQILGNWLEKFNTSQQLRIMEYKHRLQTLAHQLAKYDHGKILARGYLIARSGERVLTSVNDLALNQRLALQFADGKAQVEVVEKE